jgi:hypothetical protein
MSSIVVNSRTVNVKMGDSNISIFIKVYFVSNKLKRIIRGIDVNDMTQISNKISRNIKEP